MDPETEAVDRDRADLNAYYDGELGWWRRRRFEARLDGSPELQSELAALQAMGTALREVDAEAGAPDLWARVRAGLAEQEDRAPATWGWSRGWRPVWAAAAAVAAALALTLLWRPAGPEAPAGPRIAARDALPTPEPPAADPGASAVQEPLEVARAPEEAAPVLPDPEPTPVRGRAAAPVTTALAAGTVRTIDTGGRAFLVLDDARDTTIIWLIDAPTSALPARGTSDL